MSCVPRACAFAFDEFGHDLNVTNHTVVPETCFPRISNFHVFMTSHALALVLS